MSAGSRANQSKTLKGRKGRERERESKWTAWLNAKHSQRTIGCDDYIEEKRGAVREQNEPGGRLTLEMESLLVHSDGECAVVLVIDADHSSLGKQKERRGEREWEKQAVRQGHVILHFPFRSSCPQHVPNWLSFIN